MLKNMRHWYYFGLLTHVFGMILSLAWSWCAFQQVLKDGCCRKRASKGSIVIESYWKRASNCPLTVESERKRKSNPCFGIENKKKRASNSCFGIENRNKLASKLFLASNEGFDACFCLFQTSIGHCAVCFRSLRLSLVAVLYPLFRCHLNFLSRQCVLPCTVRGSGRRTFLRPFAVP